MKKLIVSFIVILMIVIGSLSVQAGSVGIVKSKSIDRDFYIPIDDWKGEEIIMLDTPKTLRHFGYQTWDYSPGGFGGLEHGKWVSKILKITSVKKNILYHLSLTHEDTKTTVFTTVYGGALGRILFVRDLKNAKNRWMGKTIYSKSLQIHTYDGDSEAGKMFGDIKVGLESLKVIDVIPSMVGFTNHGDGIWIVVQRKNKEAGYIDVSFSWTNQYEADLNVKYGVIKSSDRPWHKKISEYNPIKRFGWTKEIVKIISFKKIQLGMTKEMVKWSWGNPTKINRGIYRNNTTEQWVYSSYGSYVYFDKDRVNAIQN